MVSSWDYSERWTPLGLAPTLHQWTQQSLLLESITHMVVTGFCSTTETEAEMIVSEFSFWDSESLHYSLDSLQAVNLWI